MTRYQTTKIRPFDIAFVLTEKSLKQLMTVLSDGANNLQFSVTFADGTTVRYHTMDEVIEQPNPKSNAIVSLIVGTPTEELNRVISYSGVSQRRLLNTRSVGRPIRL